MFVKKRVIWINYGETVYAGEGSVLTVMVPKSNDPFVHGYPQTATAYTEHLRLWLEESHWLDPAETAGRTKKGRGMLGRAKKKNTEEVGGKMCMSKKLL